MPWSTGLVFCFGLALVINQSVLGQDLPPSTEVWNGLRAGLMKDGKPGECMKGYPKTVDAYKNYQLSLSQDSLQPKLHSFQIFFNQFSDLVSTCKIESLFVKMFSIYQWEVLQPILIVLASNVTYFILLVNYLLLSLENVAGLRLAKDMEDLVVRRYFAQYTQFFVSAAFKEGNLIIVPVLFRVKPESGSLYGGCLFDTVIIIKSSYPFSPPSMVVRNQVYHPNVDLDSGQVSLRILRITDWIPVLTINSIIFAFEVVLHSPDLTCIPDNSANLEMKEIAVNHFQEFVNRVKTTIQGGWVLEKYFFERNYGEILESKRSRMQVFENTKKRKLMQDENDMKIEVCLENN